jgi:hypothetical protein
MEAGKDATIGRFLNTLAQSGTADSDTGLQLSGEMVFGLGCDLQNKAGLKKKAKRKLITRKMILSLVQVAESKGDTDQAKAYWNAYHCQERLFSSEGRVYGKYCKNRFCTLCCSIRKAEIINKYLPTIKTWKEPYFVTLTVKAVKAEKLDWLLRGIQKAFRQIREKYKKKNQRGRGKRLIGIKSLECNFNPVNQTYNPHLHIIVPDREIAVTLIVEWQKKWTKQYTSPWAQDKRKVVNIEKDLIEIIKYGSKIFTEPDMDKKAKNKIPPMVYAAALHNIFCAIKKYRLFERFGFNLPCRSIPAKQTTIFLEQCDEWIFRPSANDWLNEETGELISGYIPPLRLQFLLSQNINTELQ